MKLLPCLTWGPLYFDGTMVVRPDFSVTEISATIIHRKRREICFLNVFFKNAALSDMKENGKLAFLIRRYITGPEAMSTHPVAFEQFNHAETLKVVITGDLPPLDYIAPDGTPAGFSVAVLAELGRILHMNIETKNIDAAARAAALASRRVDCVFWFEVPDVSSEPRLDFPEEIILSEPYYSWDSVYDIGRKK